MFNIFIRFTNKYSSHASKNKKLKTMKIVLNVKLNKQLIDAKPRFRTN